MKINSHNEWDPLKEVIVGSAEGLAATIEWHNPLPIPEDLKKDALNLCKEASPQWFVDEVNEDLNNLQKALEEEGVKVHRPSVYDINKFYSSPFWTSNSNNVYNVRDLNLVVGNSVIESPSHNISRYFETTALYEIWYEYFEEGFKWIAAPKPKLINNPVEPYFRDESERSLTDEDIMHQKLTNGRLEKLHKLAEDEILFEAANTVRIGKDLLYLVSSSGNMKGAKWLKSVLGDEYNVHVTDKLYRASHLDSTVLCIKPGLVLLNSKRANKNNLPDIFNKWEKLWFEDVAKTTDIELDFQNNVRDNIATKLKKMGFNSNLSEMSSPWVGMNILSISPKVVLADERQTKLIKLLESQGLKVKTVKLRHMYTQGGGIHCATLDTVRDSTLESYC